MGREICMDSLINLINRFDPYGFFNEVANNKVSKSRVVVKNKNLFINKCAEMRIFQNIMECFRIF